MFVIMHVVRMKKKTIINLTNMQNKIRSNCNWVIHSSCLLHVELTLNKKNYKIPMAVIRIEENKFCHKRNIFNKEPLKLSKDVYKDSRDTCLWQIKDINYFTKVLPTTPSRGKPWKKLAFTCNRYYNTWS